MNNLKTGLNLAVGTLAITAAILMSAPALAGDKGKLTVLVDTFPIYQIVKNVTAGDNGINVELLLSPELGCPHNYVLTPADMRKIAGADVLVTNGLELDSFLNSADLRANSKLRGIDSSAGIQGILQSAEACEGDHDKEDDDHSDHGAAAHAGHDHHEKASHKVKDSHAHAGANPHLFASPLMSAKLAVNIAIKMSEIRPGVKSLYQNNAALFMSRMRVLNDEFTAAVKRLKNNRIVTQHGVFDYLARDVGLEIVAVIQTHPGSEPSASEMLGLVKKIKEKKAGAVFAEPQYAMKVPQTIAKEAGIPVANLDPVASGPAGAANDYFEKTMRANIQILEKTLGTR
jgi:ABC-type Zn uptake system ZnuABC Zn-binding protein ZnuA